MDYADGWGGIWEEGSRNAFVEAAPIGAVTNLCRPVDEWEPLLTRWLAGPESLARSPTLEYCAFTALVMAADYGKLRL